MPAEASESELITKLNNGDPEALGLIFERLHSELAEEARRRAHPRSRAVHGGSDAVQSAFKNLVKQQQDGKLREIRDKNHLHLFLRKITRRKQLKHARREGTKKRGGDRHLDRFTDAPDKQPGPAQLAENADAFRRLIDILPCEEQRQVARLMHAGKNRKAIQSELGLSMHKVKRRITEIYNAANEMAEG